MEKNCLGFFNFRQSMPTVTFLAFFTIIKKYEFVNCKQNKNKYVFSFNYILYCAHNIVCHYLQLDDTTINCLLVILITQLFTILLATQRFKPRLFCLHATLHKADWILTDGCVFSLMKVLEVIRSRFRLLENSFALPYIVICVVLVAFAYLSIAFDIMLVVVLGLLIVRFKC